VNPSPKPQGDDGSERIPSTDERKVATFRAMVAVLWTLVILTLCWLPRHVVQEVEKESSWFEIANLDKLVHWGIFMLFAIFWMRVGSPRGRALRVGLIGLALAVVSELGQLIPAVGRDASLADGLSDFIGVLLGLALASTLEPLFCRVESRLLRKSSA
jgi:VanZ family protein